MGKVIQFKPLRVVPKPESRGPDSRTAEQCPRCPHKLSIHITHPNGVTSCAARGCGCETRGTRA